MGRGDTGFLGGTSGFCMRMLCRKAIVMSVEKWTFEVGKFYELLYPCPKEYEDESERKLHERPAVFVTRIIESDTGDAALVAIELFDLEERSYLISEIREATEITEVSTSSMINALVEIHELSPVCKWGLSHDAFESDVENAAVLNAERRLEDSHDDFIGDGNSQDVDTIDRLKEQLEPLPTYQIDAFQLGGILTRFGDSDDRTQLWLLANLIRSVDVDANPVDYLGKTDAVILLASKIPQEQQTAICDAVESHLGYFPEFVQA